MRKVSIVLLVVTILFLVSCSPVVIPETVIETVVVTHEVTVEDTSKIAELKNKLAEKDDEIAKYEKFMASLDGMLQCVYYGYASNSKWELDGFTAFSINYNRKFYIITAGHCVDNEEYGKMTDFKFKVNGEWVYPKLLSYESDFWMNKDYAIFYSDKINKGLIPNKHNSSPMYVLGNGKQNTFSVYSDYTGMPGESGSPIINLNGEVLGILTGHYTDIDLVLDNI